MRIHDGAYGTLLQRHLHGDETVDDLCLRAPGLVVDAHRAYLDAGASVLQANSFLAHLRGSSRRRSELRRAALECARDAAATATSDRPVLVLATVGPAGDRHRDFWEPIEQALEAGVRGVLCETVTTRAMADAFCAAWEEVAAGVVDVEVLLACSVDPCSAAASTWVVDLAGEAPDPILIGLNCCEGPAGIGPLLAAIADRRGATWAMPSAGIPTGSPPSWPWSDPVRWAERVHAEVEDLPMAGIGGCCGTTPDHVAALELPSGT